MSSGCSLRVVVWVGVETSAAMRTSVTARAASGGSSLLAQIVQAKVEPTKAVPKPVGRESSGARMKDGSLAEGWLREARGSMEETAAEGEEGGRGNCSAREGRESLELFSEKWRCVGRASGRRTGGLAGNVSFKI